MSCKVVVGSFLNDALPAVALAAGTSFDANYGADFAHDGPGKMAAGFPAIPDAGNPVVYFPSNLVPYGYDVTNWTAVTGSVASSTDQDHSASADGVCFKVLGNGAQINSLELEVRSGYSYWLEGWGFGSGTGPTAKISLYNPNTKRWWNGAAWVDVIAYLDTSAAAAWVGVGAGPGSAFTVEESAVTLGPTTTVQVQLWRVDNSTADPVYFDDIYLYPGVDFAGFFGGHNIPPWVPVKWYAGDSSGGQTLVGTFTKARNQFFMALPAVLYAYAHVFIFDIGGGPLEDAIADDVLFFGDLVVGKMVTLLRGPKLSEAVGLTYAWPGQARQETPGGSRYIGNRGGSPVRRLTLKFRLVSAEQVAQAIDVWVDQARGGEESVVVLPSVDRFPKLAVYGDLGPEAGLSLALIGERQEGTAPGDLAAAQDALEHYTDLQVVVDEGAVFQLDD